MKLRALLPFSWRRSHGQASPDEQDIYIYRSVEAKPVILVTVLGVNPAYLAEIIQTTSAKFAARYRLVFLTDSSEFGVFRKYEAIFEYFTPLLEQRLHAAVMPWPSYITERWALLVAKWRPVHIIAYGQNIEAFLTATRSSADRPPVQQP